MHGSATAAFQTFAGVQSRDALTQARPLMGTANAADRTNGVADEGFPSSKFLAPPPSVTGGSDSGAPAPAFSAGDLAAQRWESKSTSDQGSSAATPQPNKSGASPAGGSTSSSARADANGRQPAEATAQAPAAPNSDLTLGAPLNGLPIGLAPVAASPETGNIQLPSAGSHALSAIEGAVAAQQSRVGAPALPTSSDAQSAVGSKSSADQPASPGSGVAVPVQSSHGASDSNSHRSDTGGNAGGSSSGQQPASVPPTLAGPASRPADAAAVLIPAHAQPLAGTSPHAGSAAANLPAAHPAAAQQTSPAAAQVQEAMTTARLIHSLQNTEIRVGIHSAEFGNISIRTSESRDSLSAQISLDHSELAKAISDSIPQMHETLGPNQRVEIRVAMNANAGSTAGGGSGASSGNPQHAWSSGGTARAGPGPIGSHANTSMPIEPRQSPIEHSNQSRLDVRI